MRWRIRNLKTRGCPRGTFRVYIFKSVQIFSKIFSRLLGGGGHVPPALPPVSYAYASRGQQAQCPLNTPLAGCVAAFDVNYTTRRQKSVALVDTRSHAFLHPVLVEGCGLGRSMAPSSPPPPTTLLLRALLSGGELCGVG